MCRSCAFCRPARLSLSLIGRRLHARLSDDLALTRSVSSSFRSGFHPRECGQQDLFHQSDLDSAHLDSRRDSRYLRRAQPSDHCRILMATLAFGSSPHSANACRSRTASRALAHFRAHLMTHALARLRSSEERASQKQCSAFSFSSPPSFLLLLCVTCHPSLCSFCTLSSMSLDL